MIGHSLRRVEKCFGPSTQGAGIRYQNTSPIQILLASHFEKKGVRCSKLEVDGLGGGRARRHCSQQDRPVNHVGAINGY